MCVGSRVRLRSMINPLCTDKNKNKKLNREGISRHLNNKSGLEIKSCMPDVFYYFLLLFYFFKL